MSSAGVRVLSWFFLSIILLRGQSLLLFYNGRRGGLAAIIIMYTEQQGPEPTEEARILASRMRSIYSARQMERERPYSCTPTTPPRTTWTVARS